MTQTLWARRANFKIRLYRHRLTAHTPRPPSVFPCNVWPWLAGLWLGKDVIILQATWMPRRFLLFKNRLHAKSLWINTPQPLAPRLCRLDSPAGWRGNSFTSVLLASLAQPTPGPPPFLQQSSHSPGAHFPTRSALGSCPSALTRLHVSLPPAELPRLQSLRLMTQSSFPLSPPTGALLQVDFPLTPRLLSQLTLPHLSCMPCSSSPPSAHLPLPVNIT